MLASQAPTKMYRYHCNAGDIIRNCMNTLETYRGLI